MLSKRKEYHVDCGAAKATKFFLMCKSHIIPDMSRGGIDKNLRKIICPKINFEVWKL
jgi:hypothetical protein